MALKLCRNHLFLNIGQKYRNVQTRWFKSSIQTESASTSSASGNYSKLMMGSFFGSIGFFLLGNNGIQQRVSNVINEHFCLDYYAVKETYSLYIMDDLSKWEQADPTKRLLAVMINSLAAGLAVGFVPLPTIARIAIVLVAAKFYNQQSPGYMFMGLRAVCIEDEDKFGADDIARNDWRAQMDITNMVRRQLAFCPVELVIYIGCLGSMAVASVLTASIYASHVVQFYSTSNRTWLDKWSNIQVIDLAKLEKGNEE